MKNLLLALLLAVSTATFGQKILPVVEVPVSQPEQKIAIAIPRVDTGICDIKIRILTFADTTVFAIISFPPDLLGEEIRWNSDLSSTQKYIVGPASYWAELPPLPEGTTTVNFFFNFNDKECQDQKITATVVQK